VSHFICLDMKLTSAQGKNASSYISPSTEYTQFYLLHFWMHAGIHLVVLNAFRYASYSSEFIQLYLLYFWMHAGAHPVVLNAYGYICYTSECRGVQSSTGITLPLLSQPDMSAVISFICIGLPRNINEFSKSNWRGKPNIKGTWGRLRGIKW